MAKLDTEFGTIQGKSMSNQFLDHTICGKVVVLHTSELQDSYEG